MIHAPDSIRIRSVVVLAAVAAGAAAQDSPRRLTLQQTIAPEELVRYEVATPRASWLDADGVWEVVLPDGAAERRVRVDPRTLEERALEAAPAADPVAASPARVSLRDGNLVLRAADGERVLATGGRARELHVSPDQVRASFVVDNDLTVVDLDSMASWRVTDDGGDEVFNGVLDWVYQEEVYGRGKFQGHWWSPDSRRVAFLRLDERQVKPFAVVDHVPAPRIDDERAVVAEWTRYPKAGDPNPMVALCIADVGSRSVVTVDLSKYRAEEPLVVRVGWTPRGDRLVFQVQNRIQTWLDLVFADPTTGAVATALRETSDTWVDVIDTPHWLGDGTFLWWSERTGYQNLYRYHADGSLIGAVTDARWQMTGIARVDEKRGVVFVEGRGESALDRHLYRVGLLGEDCVRLTKGPGTHAVTLSPDGRFFADLTSSLSTRPELRLCAADGTVSKVFESARSSDDATYGFAVPELVSVAARDGYPLDATVLSPAVDGPFGVFVDTYSGPDAPTVRNAWRPSAWHQFLVQNGVIVLQCNVRSASGRGQAATGTCYRQFGVQELRDLEDAVAFVCRERGGDAARVGISGWSYGGFMAAFALTHSRSFALGLAGAGVHDWQLYDSIYTERYMSTPQLNPDGYRRSSVIEAAANLSGHLVVLHGTLDDNVHLQNSIRLVDALQRAGKDFELMLYPKSRHGVRRDDQRVHMRRLMWRAIQRHLLH